MPKSSRSSKSAAQESGRVFGYARVSTDKQTSEGHSLGDQENRIRGYAQSIGLSVSEMFIEGGVSGGKRLVLRPKGAQLLASVQHGDHVICTKLDRMFRSAQDALNVAADLRERGVHLHILDIGGEVTGAGAAKLVFSVLAAVAEMERERIGERVRSVKQHLRESGYYTGGIVPVGYSVTADGKLAADGQWDAAVVEMKRLRAEGHTYRMIAATTSERFTLTMDHTTVYRILNGKRLSHVA